MNNLKQIMLALLNYETPAEAYPGARQLRRRRQAAVELASAHPAVHRDRQALYEQFHLDEPWDSEHNKS